MNNLADLAQDEKFSDFKKSTFKILNQKIREHEELQSYFNEIEQLKKNTKLMMDMMEEK